MMGWILAIGAAYIFSQQGKVKSRPKPKIESGTAQLRAGKTYRIEIDLDGAALRAKPQEVAQGLDNGLRMGGAYDVLIQPSIPLRASYSMLMPGDLPVVLDVPVSQSIGGVPGEYTFRSVQEIEGRKAAA